MIRRVVIALGIFFALGIVAPNTRALYEGVCFYLRDVVAYDPRAVVPLDRAGRYAAVYDLVALRNDERRAYLRQQLDALAPHVRVVEIPIPASPQTNLWVRFADAPGALTIYAAHYDKLRDAPSYQGASDNTAAVGVLLAGIRALAMRGDGGARAFLFTGEEETGLRGAHAFVEYARANNLMIRAVVNFDNLGRGALAIRPSAEMPGFVFALPFAGDIAFDGRTLRASPPVPPPNARLTQELLRAQPGVVVYERFTAVSDSNVFQASGMDTVAISGDDMYYLEQTWHTDADRVELLDTRNLDRAWELIVGAR